MTPADVKALQRRLADIRSEVAECAEPDSAVWFGMDRCLRIVDVLNDALIAIKSLQDALLQGAGHRQADPARVDSPK